MYRSIPLKAFFVPFRRPFYRLMPLEESGRWLTNWLTRSALLEWLLAARVSVESNASRRDGVW